MPTFRCALSSTLRHYNEVTVDVGSMLSETEPGKSVELSSRAVERARTELSTVILCILEDKVHDHSIS